MIALAGAIILAFVLFYVFVMMAAGLVASFGQGFEEGVISVIIFGTMILGLASCVFF
jgi:hypothetical protein